MLECRCHSKLQRKILGQRVVWYIFKSCYSAYLNSWNFSDSDILWMKGWFVENDSEKPCNWREDANFLRLKLWMEDQNASLSREKHRRCPHWAAQAGWAWGVRREGWALGPPVADSSRDKAGTHTAAFHPHLSCSGTHCGSAQEESFHLVFTSAVSSIWLRRYFILSLQRNFGTYGILKAILTGNIPLQIPRTEVFSVEVGPPLVKRTAFERNVWQAAAVEGHLEQWIVCG